MAAQLVCDMCQEQPGRFMQTNLLNGDSIVVCGGCAFVFFFGGTRTVLEMMPPEVVAAYGDDLPKMAAEFAAMVADAMLTAGLDSALYGREENPATGDMEPIISESDARQETAVSDESGQAEGDVDGNAQPKRRTTRKTAASD